MDKIVEMSIKKYPRFAERRVGFIDGYKQAIGDVLSWLNKNGIEYFEQEFNQTWLIKDLQRDLGLLDK